MESLSTEKLINVFAYPLRTNSRLFTLTQQFKFKEKGKEDWLCFNVFWVNNRNTYRDNGMSLSVILYQFPPIPSQTILVYLINAWLLRLLANLGCGCVFWGHQWCVSPGTWHVLVRLSQQYVGVSVQLQSAEPFTETEYWQGHHRKQSEIGAYAWRGLYEYLNYMSSVASGGLYTPIRD